MNTAIKVSFFALISLCLEGCSDARAVSMCEEKVKLYLKSPASFERVSSSVSKVESISVREARAAVLRYNVLKHGENFEQITDKTQDKGIAETLKFFPFAVYPEFFSTPEKLEARMNEKVSKVSIYLKYDAQNAFGAKLRGSAECLFANTYLSETVELSESNLIAVEM